MKHLDVDEEMHERFRGIITLAEKHNISFHIIASDFLYALMKDDSVREQGNHLFELVESFFKERK